MSDKKNISAGVNLFPTPAVMVSSSDSNGNKNILAIAWTGVLSSKPPMVGVGITEERYSYRLINDTREFVINIPTVEQLTALDYCGVVSGKDIDKFSECNLTPEMAASLQWAPLIEECPVNLECKVKEVLNLGSHDYFVAEVVNTRACEEWLTEAGKLRPPAEELMCYVRGKYHQLGKLIAEHGFSR